MVTQGAREEHWREERWAGLARSQPRASASLCSALLPKRQHVQQQHLCKDSRAGITLQPQEMAIQPLERAFQPQEMELQPQETAFQPQEKAFQPLEMVFQPQEMAIQPQEKAFQPLEMALQPLEMPFQPPFPWGVTLPQRGGDWE